MQRIPALGRKIIFLSWFPAFLSIAGLAAYLYRAFLIARTKTSFLDEGLYLYKGFLFASGQQTPFADYGVWTNHAILSFLIPGYIQKWLGPGLQTGRYFMIFISLLTLLGLWVFARRWGNAWWAAGVVWVMALNPAEIKIHTLAISEGAIAAMLVWILLLTIGQDRPVWQVLLGAALTAPLVLARENMAFVPPILFMYIFWQHGWKMGLLAMFCAGLLFLAGNAFYFPDNLKFWAVRAPKLLTPFLQSWSNPSGAGRIQFVSDDSLFLVDVQAAFHFPGQHCDGLAALAVPLSTNGRTNARSDFFERVARSALHCPRASRVFWRILYLVHSSVHRLFRFHRPDDAGHRRSHPNKAIDTLSAYHNICSDWIADFGDWF
jgi:hypothetical protein